MWGNTTEYDLFYSFPLAQLEPGDSPDDMLEQGWTPIGSPKILFVSEKYLMIQSMVR